MGDEIMTPARSSPATAQLLQPSSQILPLEPASAASALLGPLPVISSCQCLFAHTVLPALAQSQLFSPHLAPSHLDPCLTLRLSRVGPVRLSFPVSSLFHLPIASVLPFRLVCP